MRHVASEINTQKPGSILLVGSSPSEQDERTGTPFSDRDGDVLMDCLREAGLRRQDVNFAFVVGTRPPLSEFSRHSRSEVESGTAALHALVARLRPNLIVALGSHAAHALVPEWYESKGAEEKRGYLWEGVHGSKVLATVEPSLAARQWVPWRTLLSFDIQKAKEEARRAKLRRPEREVFVVGSAGEAARAAAELRAASLLGCDIETVGTDELACVGFAPSPSRAVVFPAAYLDAARQVLESPAPKVFQNGAYDLYFLMTRNGIRVSGYHHDTIVAWHSLWPELAGAAQGKKRGAKRTHKSLAFLASLYTRDAWWKDYAFTSEEERYVLNGRDCCITLDVHHNLQKEIDREGVRAIYEHGIFMVWPCVVMQSRGMRVDNVLRRERLEKLEHRILALQAELAGLAIPVISSKLDSLNGKRHLFEKRVVCKCCRNGKGKRDACWSCAGFDTKPSKKALGDAVLSICGACGGAGAFECIEFNPASNEQQKILLYEMLKLPRRFLDGKLTTNEDALKSIRGAIS